MGPVEEFGGVAGATGHQNAFVTVPAVVFFEASLNLIAG